MNTFAILADATNIPKTTTTGGASVLVVYILIFAGMWFLLIAPQRKRQKSHQKMLNELAVGDKVVTASGIIGTIAGVKPTKFVVKIADNVKVEIYRSYIQGKINKSGEEEKEETAKA